MQLINEKYQVTNRKIKVLQFGEGNFLRCFVDWIISNMNDSNNIDFSSNVAVVQPLNRGLVKEIEKQNGLYTVLLEGILDKKIVESHKVIDILSDFINPYEEYEHYLDYAKSLDLQFVISNTTEAGIVLDENDTDFSKTPNSYPGKLLALLKKRYDFFNGDETKGLDIMTCELIDKNGDELKKVMIQLAKINKFDEKFLNWLINANRFYNTLVDRIVPGYPKNQVEELREKLGYVDNFMVKGEAFHLWVIEDHYNLESRFPADKILNVKFVDDVTLYKVRKVKILNGSHTVMVPVSYLAGHNTVGETMKDDLLLSFVKGYIFDEVIPTIALPKKDMECFANSVLERYENPFVRHELMSISLNSITKYKTRVLNTVIENLEKGFVPTNALYSLAALIVFYRGKRNNEDIALNDDQKFLDLFKELWSSYNNTKVSSNRIVKNILLMKDHWGYDLSENPDVLEFVSEAVNQILKNGMINDFFKEKCHFIK